jgi:hypothetical protein
MSEKGSEAEVAPVEQHVRSSLKNRSQEHSLVPTGRPAAFDPRSGFLFLKQEDFGCDEILFII